MPISIYHNPRCSKSRQALKILRERGHEPVVIEYLQSPPGATTLRDILTRLQLEPMDIIRKNEEPYRRDAAQVQAMTRDEQIAWLAKNPQALQRPIVVSGRQARIGRPPETVLEIVD
jgi:arsenate reductase